MIPEEVRAFVSALKNRSETVGRPSVARGLPRRARLSDATRELGELLLPALNDPAAATKAAHLQQRIVAERTAARQAAAEAAAAGSAAAQQAVLAASAQRAKAALDRAELTAPDALPRWFVIRQPFLIWPTGLVLDDSQSADLQSYARFRVYTDIGGDDSGNVRFYYYWTNPYPDPVFVSLASIGDWNGYCDIYLNGGLFSDDTAGATVNALLEVLPVWEPNSTFTTQQTWSIFSAAQQNNGFYSGFWQASAATHAGATLTMTDLLIPANRTVVFTMTASIATYVYDDGGASIDFSTQAYAFRSPAAVVVVTGRVVSP